MSLHRTGGKASLVRVRTSLINEAVRLQQDGHSNNDSSSLLTSTSHSTSLNSDRGWTRVSILKGNTGLEDSGDVENSCDEEEDDKGIAFLVQDEDSCHNGMTIDIPPDLLMRVFLASGASQTRSSRRRSRKTSDNSEMTSELERAKRESSDLKSQLEESMKVAEEEAERMSVLLNHSADQLAKSKEEVQALQKELEIAKVNAAEAEKYKSQNAYLKQELEKAWDASAETGALKQKVDRVDMVLAEKDEESSYIISLKDKQIEELTQELDEVNKEADEYAEKAKHAETMSEEIEQLNAQLAELRTEVAALKTNGTTPNRLKHVPNLGSFRQKSVSGNKAKWK